MEPRNTDDVRAPLVAALEASFSTGDTAGQMWLHDLSAYLQALPADDSRLAELASSRQPAPVEDFLNLAPWRVISSLNPSSWLDGYTAWGTREAG